MVMFTETDTEDDRGSAGLIIFWTTAMTQEEDIILIYLGYRTPNVINAQWACYNSNNNNKTNAIETSLKPQYEFWFLVGPDSQKMNHAFSAAHNVT